MASTPHDTTTPVPAYAHDFAARWAVRQMVAAKLARDTDLAAIYASLVRAHVDRHLEQRRRLP